MLHTAASSKGEAVARLYALAGVAPEPLGPGSTEKKSALTAVARSLELDVDHSAPKPVLGQQIAEVLGQEWDERCWSAGQTITLRGLNSLLRGISVALERRSVRRARPSLLEREEFEDFTPARDKLEAVVRMAALTEAPEQNLGPGSKERKSVLTNLARDLGFQLDERLSKPEFGAELARSLPAPWDRSCWSTGSTITLDGLNVLLAGAERRLGLMGERNDVYWTPGRESTAILSVLEPLIASRWDGRECVQQMKDEEDANWRQMEWPGFYFEMVGIARLVEALGGGPVRHANTTFDYGIDSAWDLKAHSFDRQAIPSKDVAILNDAAAFDACFGAGRSLGFVVLTGQATTSETFGAWHRELAGTRQRAPGDDRPVRARKGTFEPYRLETFHLRDSDHLLAALAGGQIREYKQGRQPDGAPRKPKYTLVLPGARAAGLRLGVVDVG